jgi:hypothetical protein
MSGSCGSCSSESSSSSWSTYKGHIFLLLVLALSLSLALSAARTKESGHTHIAWHVSRAHAVFDGVYGAEVVANLSDFRSGLLSTVLDAFDKNKPQTEVHPQPAFTNPGSHLLSSYPLLLFTYFACIQQGRDWSVMQHSCL